MVFGLFPLIILVGTSADCYQLIVRPVVIVITATLSILIVLFIVKN